MFYNQKRRFIRPRQKPGEMNKTEEKYSELLEIRKKQGEIIRYEFEKVKFKLAKKTFYTPDFFVVFEDRIEIHEVKGGYITDDAIVKYKIAVEMFPEFVWKLIQYKNKKSGWVLLASNEANNFEN